MDDGATRAVVTELYACYGGRNFERFAALLDDEIDWIIYAPLQVFPFAGQRRGKVAVLEALAGIAIDYELSSHSPESILVDGDRAATVVNAGFRQRSTGRLLRVRLANFLRVDNGRLVEFREFSDTFDVVEQALGRFIEV